MGVGITAGGSGAGDSVTCGTTNIGAAEVSVTVESDRFDERCGRLVRCEGLLVFVPAIIVNPSVTGGKIYDGDAIIVAINEREVSSGAGAGTAVYAPVFVVTDADGGRNATRVGDHDWVCDGLAGAPVAGASESLAGFDAKIIGLELAAVGVARTKSGISNADCEGAGKQSKDSN